MSEVSLTFPDGSKRSFKKGLTGSELAAGISKSLAKKAVAISLDGKLADLADPIEADASGQDHHPHRPGSAGADPARRRARDGGGGAVAVARHPGDHRPGDRERLLLRLRQAGAVPSRRSRQDRSQDARDHQAGRALHQGVLEPRQGQAVLPRQGRDVQGRAGGCHSRRRGPEDLQAGRLARSVPRPAHDLDRADRQGLQAHQVRRLLLARRSHQAAAAARLRHRLGERSRSSRPTSR